MESLRQKKTKAKATSKEAEKIAFLLLATATVKEKVKPEADRIREYKRVSPSNKLTDGLNQAVKDFLTGNARLAESALSALKMVFFGEFKKILSQVERKEKLSSSERQDVNKFLDSNFVLMMNRYGKSVDTNRSWREVSTLIRKMISQHIKARDVLDFIGRSGVIGGGRNVDKDTWSKAVAKFKSKYKKEPDLNKNPSDVRFFADIFGLTPGNMQKKFQDLVRSKAIDAGGSDGTIEAIESGQPSEYEELLRNKDIRQLLEKSMNVLTDKEKEVVKSRFGLGTKKLTESEIAKKTNQAQSTVNKSLQQALAKLKNSPAMKQYIRLSEILSLMNKTSESQRLVKVAGDYRILSVEDETLILEVCG